MGFILTLLHALSAYWFLAIPGNEQAEDLTDEEIIENVTSNNINKLLQTIAEEKLEKDPIMFAPIDYAAPTAPKSKLNNEGN